VYIARKILASFENGVSCVGVKTLEENVRPKEFQEVRVKEMGNIIEIMYSQVRNQENVIKKISGTEYIDLRTGEVKEFQPIENRSSALNEVRKSLGRLRDYINTNVVDIECCKWVTLTYAENMTDPKQLKKDFEKFNKRMQYHFKENKYEYIVAMEPQGRGAWHAHMIMIFNSSAPYIDNNFMAEKWGHGFTTTKNLDKVDNIGAYLTAYLGDMEMSEVKNMSDKEKNNFRCSGLKEIEVLEDGKKVSKSVLKGGRLHLYPPKFNLYRCSKGIKKPIVNYEEEFQAQKKISAATLTFERTIKITDTNSSYDNTINYRYYNLKRKENQL